MFCLPLPWRVRRREGVGYTINSEFVTRLHVLVLLHFTQSAGCMSQTSTISHRINKPSTPDTCHPDGTEWWMDRCLIPDRSPSVLSSSSSSEDEEYNEVFTTQVVWIMNVLPAVGIPTSHHLSIFFHHQLCFLEPSSCSVCCPHSGLESQTHPTSSPHGKTINSLGTSPELLSSE